MAIWLFANHVPLSSMHLINMHQNPTSTQRTQQQELKLIRCSTTTKDRFTKLYRSTFTTHLESGLYWRQRAGSLILRTYRYGKRNDPEEKKAFWEQVDFIEAHLIKGKFLTGDNMTIADVSLAMSMSMPMVYLGSNCYAKHPKVKGERFDITDKEFIHCPNTSVIYVACVFHLKRRLILA